MAGRAGSPDAAAGWAGQLDRELASLGDPVSALTRVNTSERAAVAPAAERVRQQVERVRPLVEAREAELPRAMLEGWQQMSGSVQVSRQALTAAPRRLDHRNASAPDRRKRA